MRESDSSGCNEQQGVPGETVCSSGLGTSDEGSSQGHGQTHTGCAEGDDSGCGSGDDGLASSDSECPSSNSISIEQQLKLLRDPISFCQTFCASHTYSGWQRAFLKDCRVVNEDGRIQGSDWPRTVVLAAVNGSGKTEILADVIRYLLSTVPGCVIPITSPIYRQLEMLENYLKAQNHKFPGWTCVEGKLTAPNGNFARWFATDTPTAVESFHGPFLVRIIEEAKSMADEIFDQTNRWQPKLTIIVSSKGLASGRLYESITTYRERNKIHEVDANMCPWISKKWIAEQIEEHGVDSPLVKSMIKNEFSDVDIRNLITMDQISRCLKVKPQFIKDDVVCSLDVSAAKKGGDECVGYSRTGNRFDEPYIFPYCKSEMEVVGLAVTWIRKIKAKHLFIDEGGLGGPIAARIAEIFDGDNSVTVHRVDFGSKDVFNDKLYFNKAAEMYGEMANGIELCKWILPSDVRTHTQLVARQVKPRSDGLIQLVSKKDLAKSPDRADSIVMCAQEPKTSQKITYSHQNHKEHDIPGESDTIGKGDDFTLGNGM